MSIAFDGKAAGGGMIAGGTVMMNYISNSMVWHLGLWLIIIGAVALGFRLERKK